jgi:hypothetical protein
MDEVKKPTSLLVGTNIIFSVGSFMYLYKRMEQLQNDNIEMKKNIANLASKLTKNNNEDLQTEELLKNMHKEVKALKHTSSRIDDYEEDLKAIVSALEASNIELDMPVKSKNKSKKKKDKHKMYVYSESETSESEETPKKRPQSSYKKKYKEDLKEDDLIDLMRLKK